MACSNNRAQSSGREPGHQRWVIVRITKAHIITAGSILIAGGALTIVRQALTTGPILPSIAGDFSLGRWLAGTEFPGLPMICAGRCCGLWRLSRGRDVSRITHSSSAPAKTV